MKIYTGSGDNGETRGLDGAVLSKSDPLICLIGDADELCAQLGVVKAMITAAVVSSTPLPLGDDTAAFIESVQKNILKLTACVSGGSSVEYMIGEGDVAALTAETDRLSSNAAKGFVLPGSSVIDAHIHVARTVARRVERRFFAVSAKRGLCPAAGAYLNRLSDYLFALSSQKNL